jgi:hypothetical protein
MKSSGDKTSYARWQHALYWLFHSAVVSSLVCYAANRGFGGATQFLLSLQVTMKTSSRISVALAPV